MAIDLEKSRGLNLREASRHWPDYKDGKPCHVSRVLRAILKGTRVPGDRRIYLEALCLSGQWITTLEAIREYGERIAAAKIGHHQEATSVEMPSTIRSKSSERAARELDQIGF